MPRFDEQGGFFCASEPAAGRRDIRQVGSIWKYLVRAFDERSTANSSYELDDEPERFREPEVLPCTYTSLGELINLGGISLVAILSDAPHIPAWCKAEHVPVVAAKL